MNAATRPPAGVDGFEGLRLLVPIETKSEKNERNRWGAAKRTAEQRRVVRAVLDGWSLRPPVAPLVVTLTRLMPGELDDDNLPRALSAVRDEIAAWLGVNDRLRDVVRYAYEQRKVKRGAPGWGVRIEIVPACAHPLGAEMARPKW